MVTATKEKLPPAKLSGFRPTPEDERLLEALHRELGVDDSQIFRLAIRALAKKEGVSA